MRSQGRNKKSQHVKTVSVSNYNITVTTVMCTCAFCLCGCSSRTESCEMLCCFCRWCSDIFVRCECYWITYCTNNKAGKRIKPRYPIYSFFNCKKTYISNEVPINLCLVFHFHSLPKYFSCLLFSALGVHSTTYIIKWFNFSLDLINLQYNLILSDFNELYAFNFFCGLLLCINIFI